MKPILVRSFGFLASRLLPYLSRTRHRNARLRARNPNRPPFRLSSSVQRERAPPAWHTLPSACQPEVSPRRCRCFDASQSIRHPSFEKSEQLPSRFAVQGGNKRRDSLDIVPCSDPNCARQAGLVSTSITHPSHLRPLSASARSTRA